MRAKTCPDCPEGARPRAIAGPAGRCATHHRERKKALSDASHANRLRKVYGLTAEQYWALYAAQGGRCFICQRATGKTKRLAVDHDHETGLVRGLTDSTCNFVLLGRYDTAALQRAIEYLRNPPAERMGLRVVVPGHQEKEKE